MDEECRNLVLHKRARRCSVAEVNAVLDHHPIETNRDQYLRRALALELLHLDELEEAFRDKALVDRDVASSALLVKVSERRATLLGLDDAARPRGLRRAAPAGEQTVDDRIEAALLARIWITANKGR
jgi:hypothetical protein